MGFHATGLIVFTVIVLLALIAGAVPAIAGSRGALGFVLVGAFPVGVANMVRYRDTHVRSRLLGLLFDNTTAPWQGVASVGAAQKQIKPCRLRQSHNTKRPR